MTHNLLQDEGLKTLLLQEGVVNYSNNKLNSVSASSPPSGAASAGHDDSLLSDGALDGGEQSQQQQQQQNQNILVSTRIRPLLASELQIDSRVCLEARGAIHQHGAGNSRTSPENNNTQDNDNNNEAIKVHSQITLTCAEDKRSYNFGFPAVFDENASQREVFELAAKPVVQAVLQGYHSTILAYGQTSAGKTHTMLGEHSYIMNASSSSSSTSSTSTKQQQSGSLSSSSSSSSSSLHFDPTSGLNVASPAPLTNNNNNNNNKHHSERGIIPRAATYIFDRLHSIYNTSSNSPSAFASAAATGSSPSPATLTSPSAASLSPASFASASAAASAAGNSAIQNAKQLFAHNTQIDFFISLTFVEIYLDRVRDLLETNRVNLAIREKEGLFYVDQCSEHVVNNANDVLRLLERGAKNRATSSSKMNDRSSRSHSILTLTIQRRLGDNNNNNSGGNSNRPVISGRLQLVDLAGSERVGKTNANSTQLDEACSINKSLSHLSEVIAAVLDGRQHVPYRSCALTKLLSASLGGNSRTSLIVCCSPSQYNEQETLSSLRFGSSASGIRNRATMNRLVTEEQMRKYVSKLWQAIRVLERENLILKRRLGDTPPEMLHDTSIVVPAATSSPVPIPLSSQQQQQQNQFQQQQNQQQQHATMTAEDLALQFVSQVSRYATNTTNTTSASGSANSPSPSRHLRLTSTSQPQAGTTTNSSSPVSHFGSDMQHALNESSTRLNLQQQQQQGDEPATSREFSPSSSSSHQQQGVGVRATEQHRYVSLLQEINEAIMDIEAETEDADDILDALASVDDDEDGDEIGRQQQQEGEGENPERSEESATTRQEKRERKRKERDEELAKIRKQHEGASSRERELLERLEKAEEAKESLQLNLSMWQAALKETERKRGSAWSQLSKQHFETARVLADLERAKRRYEAAEASLADLEMERKRESIERERDEEQIKRKKEELERREKEGEEKEKQKWMKTQPILTSSSCQTTSGSIEEEGNSCEAAQKEKEQQEQEEYQRKQQLHLKQQDHMKACESFMQRAVRAEQQYSNATATCSKLRDDNEELENEKSSLKRQLVVMEQRIIALRRAAGANSSSSSSSSSHSGVAAAAAETTYQFANSGNIRLSSLYREKQQQQQEENNNDNSAAANNNSSSVAAAGPSGEQQRREESSSSQNQQERQVPADLQDRIRAMQNAAQKLQKASESARHASFLKKRKGGVRERKKNG